MLKVIHTLMILAVSLCASLVYATEKAHWQNPQYIADSFVRIALQREYKETNNPKLVRWRKPIGIYFDSDAGDAALQKELLSVHAQHLSYITGIPIDYRNTPADSNLFVVFTTYDKMEDKVRQYIGNPERIRTALDEAICLGNFSLNGRSEITRGVIIIPVDYARQKARFLDCIVEEITQLMGLPNDSDQVYPSIFNDVSVDAYLSPLDYLLLKMLYSPRLKNGMNVQQVMRTMPALLTDLKAQGEIDNAVQRVQAYSLKRYLGD